MEWAFMTANFVAREITNNYTELTVTKDWWKAHLATVDAFHGPHFPEKFEELIKGIKEMGFNAIELWVAHLDPFKADEEMIHHAVHILKKYEVKVISYTAGFYNLGVTREEATRIYEVAQAIGAPVLAQGFHPSNGPLIMELGEHYNIKVGLENHPEKNPQEVIEKVHQFSPWVGSCIDTGWFATHGYDPVKAVVDLRDYLVHVHLKDVVEIGGHESCAIGNGVVNMKKLFEALKQVGYQGALTIEHEPWSHDPTSDVQDSLNRVKQWWEEV